VSWDPAPPLFISQLRTQLAGCASWISAVGSANALSRIHYPAINVGNTKGSAPDKIPAALLTRTAGGKQRWAAGAGGLGNGVLEIDFYFPAVQTAAQPDPYTVGRLEALVEAIVGELTTQEVGIPFNDNATWTEASNPTNEAIAAHSDQNPAAFRHCRAILPYSIRS
jgi:hypothetical protein